MKILVLFSGGKDSLASLIWAIKESGFKKENIKAVFCDTGWENPITYNHIKEITLKLDIELIILKSKKYNGFIDLATKKKRFPSTKAKFCTTELKVIPMIDFILDECNDNLIIIQGIRAEESKNRSLMKKQCTYFRYYFESYGTNKKGKEKFHTYRKQDVINFRKKYMDDIIRPIFDWSSEKTIKYILDFGLKPNLLYYLGFKRVGCFPCIMCNKQEIKNIINNNPEVIESIKEAEKKIGSTFFPPNYLPKRYMTKTDEKTGINVPIIENVIKYTMDKNNNLDLFDDDNKKNICSSFYNICE